MANRLRRADDVHVERLDAHATAVQCRGCRYEWHSRVMAEGLRLLGTCPKCGGELAFADAPPAQKPAESPKMDVRAPHLVLGVPRR
jgi:hypothetical protein